MSLCNSARPAEHLRPRDGAAGAARRDACTVRVSSSRSIQNNKEKEEMNCKSEFVVFRKSPRHRDVARDKGIVNVIDMQEDGSALFMVTEHLTFLNIQNSDLSKIKVG